MAERMDPLAGMKAKASEILARRLAEREEARRAASASSAQPDADPTPDQAAAGDAEIIGKLRDAYEEKINLLQQANQALDSGDVATAARLRDRSYAFAAELFSSLRDVPSELQVQAKEFGNLDNDLSWKLGQNKTEAKAVQPAEAPGPESHPERSLRVRMEIVDAAGSLNDIESQLAAGDLEGANADIIKLHDALVTLEALSDLNAAEAAAVEKARNEYYRLDKKRYRLKQEKVASLRMQPDTTAPVPATPDIGPTTEEKLEEARKRYVLAQKEVKAARGVMGWGEMTKSKDYVRAKKAADKVEADYKKARAEFVLANVDRHLAEKRKLTEVRLNEYANRDKNPLEKVAEWNKKLGEINVVDKLGYKGPFKRVAKFFNARSAISAGLLAAGFYNARGVFAGVTSGLGTYGLVISAREAYLAKNFKGNESLAKTEELIASLESRAMLDGRNQELLDNPTYKKLIEQQEKLTKETSEVYLIADNAAEYLRQQSEKNDQMLRDKFEEEKKWKKLAILAGTGTGILVGLGIPGKFVNQIKSLIWSPVAPSVSMGSGQDIKLPEVPETGGRGGLPPAAEVPAPAQPATAGREQVPPLDSTSPGRVDAGAKEALKPTQSTNVEFRGGASIDITGDEAVIRAGKRGIEGALIDLKSVNSEKYAELVKHLQATYGENVDEKAMIHKFVLDYAVKNGYNIGEGGGTDLNWIKSAEIKIGPNGAEITQQEFMDRIPDSRADVIDLETIHPQYYNVEAPGIGQIDYDNLSNPAPIPTSHFEPIPTPRVLYDPEIERISLEDDAPPSYTPGQSPAERAAEALANSREEAALSQKDISTGLKLVLQERYDKFLHKFLDISASKLNSLKNISVEEFQKRWETAGEGSSFQKKYRGVGKFYKTFLALSSIDKKISIKEYLIIFAKERNWEKIINEYQKL